MDAFVDFDHLDWDRWNIEHIAKHNVTPQEVEEVVDDEDVVVRETYKNRLQVIGPTRRGRILAVVIGPVLDQREVHYTFSARPASRKERRFYLEQRGDHER